jgi:SAM-dependent methyltransferase
MKHCLACDAHYSVSETSCPMCGFGPQIVDGFIAHAPELAHGGGGFDSAYFPVLARLEDANFWFRARNELILWTLEKYCTGFQSYLEIGCGTGYVLAGVASRFPGAILSASEIFTVGLGFAAERVPKANFLQMDARHIPFSEEFDVLGAFDVIEHIREEEMVLAQAYKALKPGGHLLLTVPQHSWMWSPSDDYARHERRYSASELRAKVSAAGFRLQRCTSFVSLLMPLMLVSRLKSKQKDAPFDPSDEFKLPSWMNAAFYRVMAMERGLIRLGLNLPAGGSLMLVAQKLR